MIGVIAGIAFAALLGLALKRQGRRIRQHGGRIPWLSLVCAAIGGVGAGYALNSLEFELGDDSRLAGIPIPVVFFRLEDGQWVDFVVPFPVVNWIINLALFGLCGAFIAAAIVGRGSKPKNPSVPPVSGPGAASG
jgi:hypothetical protein